ncbi:hypothetical protein K466DRAFT_605972 [Polyporus arcularius HHB13444]|uniref:Uncharacterized protein n=1 Tax=Polyporus arcularius HHB13444 TaxID=1314778 RepID=A0A5C3NRK1_9APHY|nr:hypothetical protein K466DRAFT_605972 [Polyporus arcularius HHB13444]
MGYTAIVDDAQAPPPEPPTWGEVLVRQCRQYPNFDAQVEFDIYALGLAGALLPPPEDASKSEIRAYLAKTFDAILKEHDGVIESVQEMVKEFMRKPAHITGMRPVHPDGYRMKAVPGTQYSIRMWEGSRAAAEWVFEIYDNVSNRPFWPPPGTVQVWYIPNPGRGEGYPDRHEIAAIEDVFNTSLGGRVTGKTYVLRDGDKCVVNFKEMNTSISVSAPDRQPDFVHGINGHRHYKLDF